MTFSDTVWTNCRICGKLHIFNRKKITSYDWKYSCSECGAINDITTDIGAIY